MTRRTLLYAALFLTANPIAMADECSPPGFRVHPLDVVALYAFVFLGEITGHRGCGWDQEVTVLEPLSGSAKKGERFKFEGDRYAKFADQELGLRVIVFANERRHNDRCNSISHFLIANWVIGDGSSSIPGDEVLELLRDGQ